MSKYIIKKLNKNYKNKVIEHFLRLDKEDSYNRFCCYMNKETIKVHVNDLNFEDNGIFGIFDDNLDIIGLGECIVNEHGGSEIGFSVEKEYQGNGLGSKLMDRMVRFAKSLNKSRLEMMCLKTNKKSIAIAKKFGLEIHLEDGDSIALINLKNNNPNLENLNEKLEDSLAYCQIKQKENLNNWKIGNKLLTEVVIKTISNTFELMRPKVF